MCSLFARILARRVPGWLVREYVKPFDGCRILDLGCGPGRQTTHVPDTVSEYVGVDLNPAYIEAARHRHGGRPGFVFVCDDLASFGVPHRNHYDIVMAIGIVHHLGDTAARRLFSQAYEALVPGGRLITYDGVYVDRQHPVARWLVARDRGKAVRTADGYRQLARLHFDRIDDTVLHNTLRVPYTTFVMTCTKT